jgi:hypothetical protein
MDRLTAYRGVIKNLQQYFNERAMVEHEMAKAMHKVSTSMVLPFKDGEQQFLGKGGLQDVCVGLRESSQIQSEQHVAGARFVEETIVKNLRRLKQDVKARIKTLKSDANLYATRVFKEREATQDKIGQLAKAIGLHENSGSGSAGGLGSHQAEMEKMQSDPYLIHLGKSFLLLG